MTISAMIYCRARLSSDVFHLVWLHALGPVAKIFGVWRDKKEAVWGTDSAMGEWSLKVTTRASQQTKGSLEHLWSKRRASG